MVCLSESVLSPGQQKLYFTAKTLQRPSMSGEHRRLLDPDNQDFPTHRLEQRRRNILVSSPILSITIHLLGVEVLFRATFQHHYLSQ